MTRPPGCRYAFRLYLERGRRDHYRVLIFATKAAMYAHFRADSEYGRERVGRLDWDALTRSWERIVVRGRRAGVRDGTQPDIGELLMIDAKARSGLVAHELGHAAIRYAQHRGWDAMAIMGPETQYTGDQRPNERFCDVLGFLTAQFWRHYYRQRDDARRRRRRR